MIPTTVRADAPLHWPEIAPQRVSPGMSRRHGDTRTTPKRAGSPASARRGRELRKTPTCDSEVPALAATARHGPPAGDAIPVRVSARRTAEDADDAAASDTSTAHTPLRHAEDRGRRAIPSAKWTITTRRKRAGAELTERVRKGRNVCRSRRGVHLAESWRSSADSRMPPTRERRLRARIPCGGSAPQRLKGGVDLQRMASSTPARQHERQGRRGRRAVTLALPRPRRR